MSDAMRAETVLITGDGGDEIEAYLAQPLDGPPAGGVVVIHHMPGYDEATKEITRKFAAHGYLAICPNLYCREAPGASPDDAAAAARAQGGVPDERLVGDVGGAAGPPPVTGRRPTARWPPSATARAAASRSWPPAASTSTPPSTATAPSSSPRRPRASRSRSSRIAHLADDLSCPLLGLFGAEDQYPSPDEVAELEKVLTDAGKDFEFHTYEGAGHAFFATDRPSYRPEAAGDGWQRIWDFFGRHLSNG